MHILQGVKAPLRGQSPVTDLICENKITQTLLNTVATITLSRYLYQYRTVEKSHEVCSCNGLLQWIEEHLVSKGPQAEIKAGACV